MLSCVLHAALWTNHERRCANCFGVTVCESPANRVSWVAPSKRLTCRNAALIVIDGLYIAGAQRHVLHLMRVFRDCGYGSIILCLEGGGRWAEQFLLDADQVVVASSPIDWHDFASVAVASDVSFISAHLVSGVDWMARHSPSSVRRYGHLHSAPSPHEMITSEWLRESVPHCTSLFVPSRETELAIRKAAGSIAGMTIAVLPNGLSRSVPPRRSRRRQSSRPDSRICIAVVSRIDEDKFSIDLFIATLRLLSSTHTIICRVAGSGELFDKLASEIAQQRWTSVKVELLGFLDEPTALYHWADVLFLPSIRESMPYAALEALTAGCPVVAPNLGFLRDSSPSGIVRFAEGNAEAAAFAIHSINGRDVLEIPGSSQLESRIPTSEEWVKLIKEAYEL